MKFIEIEERKVNPVMIIEVVQDIKEHVLFHERPTPNGKVTEIERTGKWFSSVLVLGTEPIVIIRETAEEVKEELVEIERELYKH
jgi:hypothetical protein